MVQHMQIASTLYLYLSAKTANSMEILESSFKQLNSCVHGHYIISQSLLNI